MTSATTTTVRPWWTDYAGSDLSDDAPMERCKICSGEYSPFDGSWGGYAAPNDFDLRHRLCVECVDDLVAFVDLPSTRPAFEEYVHNIGSQLAERNRFLHEADHFVRPEPDFESWAINEVRAARSGGCK